MSMNRLIVAGLLALTASAASAERVAYTCNFDTRCDGAGCTSNAVSYDFIVDTAAGSGEMRAEGQSYPGGAFASEGMTHFVMVNDFGAELTTITDTGGAFYTGHMAFDGVPSFYRLEGQCTQRSK
jgi:hypothetical protein